MTREKFDLITIGAGSGGVAASRYAASLGARVLICEASRLGGTCVIRGCVPKKIYSYAAQFADAFADSPAFGWSFDNARFDLARLRNAKDAEIARLESVYRDLLSNSGVRIRMGRAGLVGAHAVSIGGSVYEADKILIATGGSPYQPPIPGMDLAITSDDALGIGKVPSRILILGGGYIALEFASIFSAFGSNVTLAYRAPLPLRGFDEDLRRRAAQALESRGVTLIPNFIPLLLERKQGVIACHGSDGALQEAEVVMNALGRLPNSADLALYENGVRVNAETGAIIVDECSRTSVTGTYAIGDVTNRRNLTPVAIAEGRAFVDSEFRGISRTVNHVDIATAVFSQPPLAAIGLNESAAVAQGYDPIVYEADFRPMKNAVSGRSERTYIKVVVDRSSDKVIGLHMIGIDAPEIVQGLAVAVTLGATKKQFDNTMAVHPTVAEEFVLLRTPRS